MIPPDILTTIFGALFAVLMCALGFVGILALGRACQRKQRVNARLNEPETYGDDGGRPEPVNRLFIPTAHEIGSCRPPWEL